MAHAEHTPGPWVVGDPHGSYVYIHARGRQQHDCLAEVVWKMEIEDRSPRLEANAYLIAAAPDLLDALQNLMNGIDTGLVRLETDADEALANGLQRIRSAIAKATGETHG